MFTQAGHRISGGLSWGTSHHNRRTLRLTPVGRGVPKYDIHCRHGLTRDRARHQTGKAHACELAALITRLYRVGLKIPVGSPLKSQSRGIEMDYSAICLRRCYNDHAAPRHRGDRRRIEH